MLVSVTGSHSLPEDSTCLSPLPLFSLLDVPAPSAGLPLAANDQRLVLRFLLSRLPEPINSNQLVYFTLAEVSNYCAREVLLPELQTLLADLGSQVHRLEEEGALSQAWVFQSVRYLNTEGITIRLADDGPARLWAYYEDLLN